MYLYPISQRSHNGPSKGVRQRLQSGLPVGSVPVHPSAQVQLQVYPSESTQCGLSLAVAPTRSAACPEQSVALVHRRHWGSDSGGQEEAVQPT